MSLLEGSPLCFMGPPLDTQVIINTFVAVQGFILMQPALDCWLKLYLGQNGGHSILPLRVYCHIIKKMNIHTSALSHYTFYPQLPSVVMNIGKLSTNFFFNYLPLETSNLMQLMMQSLIQTFITFHSELLAKSIGWYIVLHLYCSFSH